jgi:hypothetical protein
MMNDSQYAEIAANIDEGAIRAPRSKSGESISEAFIEYLQLLYTPDEAKIARYLKVAEDLAWITFNPMWVRQQARQSSSMKKALSLPPPLSRARSTRS